MTAYGERVARLEAEVSEIRRGQREHKEQTTKEFAALNTKLDDLLSLRAKGIGAFWLASSLIGTGIIGFLYYLFGGK